MARSKKRTSGVTSRVAPPTTEVKDTPMTDETVVDENIATEEPVVDPVVVEATQEDVTTDDTQTPEPEQVVEPDPQPEPAVEEGAVVDVVDAAPAEEETQFDKDLASYIEVCDKIKRGLSPELARSRANRLNILLSNVIKAKDFDAMAKFMNTDKGKDYFSERRALVGLQHVDRRLSDRISTMFNLFNAVATKTEISFSYDVVAKHMVGIDPVDFTSWVKKKLG